MNTTSSSLRWRFDYLDAYTLNGDQEVDVGDLLALVFRGQFRKPELAPAGAGVPAIVTRLERDEHGLLAAVELALMEAPNARP